MDRFNRGNNSERFAVSLDRSASPSWAGLAQSWSAPLATRLTDVRAPVQNFSLRSQATARSPSWRNEDERPIRNNSLNPNNLELGASAGSGMETTIQKCDS